MNIMENSLISFTSAIEEACEASIRIKFSSSQDFQASKVVFLDQPQPQSEEFDGSYQKHIKTCNSVADLPHTCNNLIIWLRHNRSRHLLPPLC
jgi:hypothetical protein